MDKSEAERSATAWPFSGPAVFSKVISRAMKLSPEIAVTLRKKILHEKLIVICKTYEFSVRTATVTF